MKITRDGITGSPILSMEAVERRWQENPLDTTYPHIPWWRRRRWCECPDDMLHFTNCIMSAVYGGLATEPQFYNPVVSTWMDGLPSTGQFDCPHLWMICGECGDKLGEVNSDAHMFDCPHPDDDMRDWA